jgi:hypothetical protein
MNPCDDAAICVPKKEDVPKRRRPVRFPGEKDNKGEELKLCRCVKIGRGSGDVVDEYESTPGLCLLMQSI